ncbi:MAG: response regulator [Gammaproteobacteria bacterium]|nr:response regulator [Gammaproteobacteria bacterium]
MNEQRDASDSVISDRQHCLILVDDEQLLLDIATDTLEDAGYRVIAFKSPQQVLIYLQQHQDIDLLITDVEMPEVMSGIELAKQAVALHPKLVVLTLSGRDLTSAEALLLTGIQHRHLNKPYRYDDLLFAVGQLLK